MKITFATIVAYGSRSEMNRPAKMETANDRDGEGKCQREALKSIARGSHALWSHLGETQLSRIDQISMKMHCGTRTSHLAGQTNNKRINDFAFSGSTKRLKQLQPQNIHPTIIVSFSIKKSLVRNDSQQRNLARFSTCTFHCWMQSSMALSTDSTEMINPLGILWKSLCVRSSRVSHIHLSGKHRTDDVIGAVIDSVHTYSYEDVCATHWMCPTPTDRTTDQPTEWVDQATVLSVQLSVCICALVCECTRASGSECIWNCVCLVVHSQVRPFARPSFRIARHLNTFNTRHHRNDNNCIAICFSHFHVICFARTLIHICLGSGCWIFVVLVECLCLRQCVGWKRSSRFWTRKWIAAKPWSRTLDKIRTGDDRNAYISTSGMIFKIKTYFSTEETKPIAKRQVHYEANKFKKYSEIHSTWRWWSTTFEIWNSNFQQRFLGRWLLWGEHSCYDSHSLWDGHLKNRKFGKNKRETTNTNNHPSFIIRHTRWMSKATHIIQRPNIIQLGVAAYWLCC